MKPTYGAVSRYGVVAFGSSLDQVGPFGRSVEDVALAMNALVAPGRDPFDSTSQDCPVDFLEHLEDSIAGHRVGIVPALMEAEGLSKEERAAVDAAARAFTDQGAELVEVELPHVASAIAAYYVIAPCEAFSNLARFDGVRYGYQEPDCSTLAEQTSLSRARGFGEEAKRRQMLGAYLCLPVCTSSITIVHNRCAHSLQKTIVVPTNSAMSFLCRRARVRRSALVRFLIPPRCTPRTCLPFRATLQETAV